MWKQHLKPGITTIDASTVLRGSSTRRPAASLAGRLPHAASWKCIALDRRLLDVDSQLDRLSASRKM